jgi:hypothetical protein
MSRPSNEAQSRRAATRWALRAVLIGLAVYSLLLLAWPAVRSPFVSVWSAVASAALRDFGQYGSFSIAPLKPPQGALDAQSELRDARRRQVIRKPISLRAYAYKPTAVLLACIAAAPLPWRRLLVFAPPAILALAGLVILRIMLATWSTWEESSRMLSPTARSVLDAANGALVYSPTSEFVIPILIWATAQWLNRINHRKAGKSS